MARTQTRTVPPLCFVLWWRPSDRYGWRETATAPSYHGVMSMTGVGREGGEWRVTRPGERKPRTSAGAFRVGEPEPPNLFSGVE